MINDRFREGMETIKAALEAALHERGVTGAVIAHDSLGTDPQDTQFTLTVGGKTQSSMFVRQEIEDSALAIDAPSALRVRMMVGPFVR